MKKIFLHLIFVFVFQVFYGQDFTWVKGPDTSGSPGTYGIMGVSAAANNPGGRHGSGRWTDAAGNLWLFGGEINTTNYNLYWMNDMWKYNPVTNEWTWMRGSNSPNSSGSYGTMGISSPTNDPPARELMACWTDNSGNFWMYGGEGVHSASTYTPTQFGDLWKYDPNMNEWTWVKGPSNAAGYYPNYGVPLVPANTNHPGCRRGPATWKDTVGDLWIFGGEGPQAPFLGGYLNDLWRYNISSNMWTWISGAPAPGQLGTYIIKGVASTTYAPGGRECSASFIDNSGNLYLFGGKGIGVVPLVGYLSDLWKFDPINLTWTWLHGTSNVNMQGTFGTSGISSPLNFPGGLEGPAGWRDASGNFWLFGGEGKAPTNNIGQLHDIFRYNAGLNEWTWIKGSALHNQSGNYGTLGLSAASNMPGGRKHMAWWKDHNENLWIFGGEGWDKSSTTSNQLNDLWKYKLPCNPDSIMALPGNTICSDQSLTLTAVNGDPGTKWYSSPSSSNNIGTGSILTLTNLGTSASATVYNYYAGSDFCTTQPKSSISITVNSVPVLTVSTSDSLICRLNSSTLTAIGAINYTWNTVPVQTGSAIIVSPYYTTYYLVNGSGLGGCSQNQSIIQHVDLCESILDNEANSQRLQLFPNPNTGEFTIRVTSFYKNHNFTILNSIGQQVYSYSIIGEQSYLKPELTRGMYTYKLSFNEKVVEQGKLIIQ